MRPAGHHEETFSRYVALSWANALYSRPVAKGGGIPQALREIAAKLIEIAAKLISMAVRGDLQAMKIADQIQGKVPQAQIIQGYDDGGPIRLFAAVPLR